MPIFFDEHPAIPAIFGFARVPRIRFIPNRVYCSKVWDIVGPHVCTPFKYIQFLNACWAASLKHRLCVCVFACFILQSAVGSHRLDSVGRLFFVKFWIPIVCQVSREADEWTPIPKENCLPLLFPFKCHSFLD